MKKKLYSFLNTTYHRRLLDEVQNKHIDIFQGKVLDIGGTSRGGFMRPNEKEIDEWVFADINEEEDPDIILDVTNMEQIDAESVDIIRTVEVFEHVEDVCKGLNECYRALKDGGLLVVSTPFMYPIHSAPHDYQRWTDKKWLLEAKKAGFKLQNIDEFGSAISVLGDIFKKMSKSANRPTRYLLYLFLIFYELIFYLDKINFLPNFVQPSGYVDGYFFIFKK